MTPLSRHVLVQHVRPFAYTLAGLTALWLLPTLRTVLGQPLGSVLRLLGLSLPFIWAMAVPLAVLVAVLYVYTHLAREQPPRATVLQLASPALAAAAGIALLALLWNDQVVPRSNYELRSLSLSERQQPPHAAGDREMSIAELRRAAAEAKAGPTPQRAANFEVEIQKKFAVAAACLVLALFAAPVGLLLGRGGVLQVVGVSLVVVVIYYMGLIVGEGLGDSGELSPFLAMWMPNLVFGAIGLIVLWQLGKREGDIQGKRE